MPAGVAVMTAGLRIKNGREEARQTSVGATASGAARAAAGADRADIAEQLVEEAFLPPERRSGAVAGIKGQDQLLAGALDRGDVALGIEADEHHELLGNTRIAEGELVGVARHIIPVVRRELAGQRRSSEKLLDGFLIVDSR